ncbi:SDR family NAD(P)-dependent oxidoreductase [Nocardioides mangrovi]|uniref:SDR family oxidoreductase n=1 Tax=Nocardioides mangrovi TaxID=2874580 RepID=A0ABS7UAC0_9ACTN|nr:SDR family oxidoreductase [Nocardioides mangrovi]MBZ5737676.1 SDR family oxidoreductase [Nocardioides mangrovi]
MTNEKNQKIAIVTGGNRGLGRSEALALAASGVDVLLTYRSNADEAAEVVAQIQESGREAVALRLDTTETETFAAFADDVRRELADRWDRETFDVLVNNAGAMVDTPVGETTMEQVQALVAVHFVGPVFLTQALLPLIADGGRVINTSTGLARFTGDPSYSVYASMKGAIEVYTRYLAKALGSRRIAVNTIAPGATGTDFGGGYLRDSDQVRDHLAGVIAMGHVGDPDDIGTAVAALASDAMGWVTGQRIEASGGMNL